MTEATCPIEAVEYKLISDTALLDAVRSLQYRLADMPPDDLADAIWERLEDDS